MAPLDTALKVLEEESAKVLPSGYSIDYAGESRQLRKEGEQFLPYADVSIGIGISGARGAVQLFQGSLDHHSRFCALGNVWGVAFHRDASSWRSLDASLVLGLDDLLEYILAGGDDYVTGSGYEEQYPHR